MYKVPWIRPAQVFDHHYLREVLEEEFIKRTSNKNPGVAVLMYSSLETFCHDDGVKNKPQSSLERIWLDLYTQPERNVQVLIIVPIDQHSSVPPGWLGIEYIQGLVNWLRANTAKQTQMDKFKELCERVHVVFVPREIKNVTETDEKEIAYAFGIYFVDLMISDLYESLELEDKNSLTEKVQMILGTSIGEPFGRIKNGRFEYKLILSFDKCSLVPLDMREQSLCIVNEHITLLINAYKDRIAIPIDQHIEHSKTKSFCGIIDKDPKSFDEFIAWSYLHLERISNGWKHKKPDNDAFTFLEDAFAIAKLKSIQQLNDTILEK